MIYYKNIFPLSTLEKKIIYQNAECPIADVQKILEKKGEALDQACLEKIRFFIDSREGAQALVNACYKVAKTNPNCINKPPLNDGWHVGEMVMAAVNGIGNGINQGMDFLVATAHAEEPNRKAYTVGKVFGADVKTRKIHEIIPPDGKFTIAINNNLGQVKPGNYNIVWSEEQKTYIFEGNPALGRVKVMPGDQIIEDRPKAVAPTSLAKPQLSERKNDPESGFFRYSKDFPKGFDSRSVYPGIDLQKGFSIEDIPSTTEQKIVISRKSGKLYLFKNDTLQCSFGAESGGSNFFDKVKEGDKTTPLGIFRISSKNSNSKYKKALVLNYPTVEDAERGKKEGIITQQQYNAILSAHRNNTLPPQNTPLGGFIEIHGNYNTSGLKGFLKFVGIDLWSNRRFGCVRLQDQDVEEIFSQTKTNSPVVILP